VRTPNELERLADVRFRNALATEAHLGPTLEPTHRLLAKDARSIYSAPPASLRATGDRSGVAGRISLPETRSAPAALGRSRAAARSCIGDSQRAVPSTADIRAGKRITRGNLGHLRSNRDTFFRPKTGSPTLRAKLHGLSPSKQRAELLRHGFGETGGWWANEFIDLFDSVTPVLEFFHRRRRGVPFDLEDVFIAASAFPGIGKAAGKVGRKANKYFRDEAPSTGPGTTARPKYASRSNLRNVAGEAKYDEKLPVAVAGKPWLRGSHRNAAKIPHQLAVRLAGRQYKDWRHFRRSFWREVARSEILAQQFDEKNIRRMKRGVAPLVEELQNLGERKSYNIDHVKELRYGGGLYDLNNLYIRSPLNHVKGK